jgi:hypothetical protein
MYPDEIGGFHPYIHHQHHFIISRDTHTKQGKDMNQIESTRRDRIEQSVRGRETS